MPASRNGRGFDAKATPQHDVRIAADIPLPPERRNQVPDLRAKGVRWYVCTTAPSRELSAAASVRRAAPEGLEPFLAYVPCEFFWRRAVRSNLRVPRREQQRPLLRHYLFVGIDGGICDEAAAALRARDGEGRNVHGLVGILGVSGHGPLPMNDVGLAWIQRMGDGESAGETAEAAGAGLRSGEAVTAGSGVMKGFAGTFIGTAEDGVVGLIAIDILGCPCEVRLPIEDVHRAA